ncbi:ECF transporter S component [Clostridium sp. UBA4548]|uniref:ECF transporter S component n=1 Tax=Clostridium sp. UBA4548 TaxID=1946361 RepID=UPI0025B88B50|nr:ECF transporter S component [Clostridium sp. UBA4548]
MKKKTNLNSLIKISLLGAIAFILMLFEFPIPGFPPFLKLDFSDLPALIGGFALGPVAGIIIEFIKNVLNIILHGSSTGGVGEFANFLVGGVFVYVASWVYHKDKSRKKAIIGLISGTIAMTLVAGLFNYFILIPIYAKLFGGLNNVIGAAAAANKSISSLASLIVIGITPFNILKGAAVSVITFASYKKVSPLIHKESLALEQQKLKEKAGNI